MTTRNVPNTNILHKSSVRVVHCGMHNGSPPGFPPHTHRTWELTVHCQGRIRTVQGKSTIETYPGTAFLHPPGSTHAEIAGEVYQLVYILFDCPGLDLTQAVLYDDPDGSLEETAKAIVREWRYRPGNFEMMTDLLIRRLVLLIERLASAIPQTDTENLIGAAATIIEDRFNEPITLEGLSKELRISAAKLRRDFVQARGQTPKEYLQSIRLRHAVAALRNTDLTLDTIAHLNGYNSASHLTRHIKAATGSTPGHLRRHGEIS